MPYYYEFQKGVFADVGKKLREAMYSRVCELEVTAYVTPEPVSFEKRCSGKRISIAAGQKWGNLFDCAWFNFGGAIPASAAGREVVAILDVSGEMCVFDRKGNPICGLSSAFGWIHPQLGFAKTVLPLKGGYIKGGVVSGGTVDIWADAGCSDLFGQLHDNGVFRQASIAVVNEQVRQLYFDFEVLCELAAAIDKDSARYHQVVYALWQSTLVLEEYSEAQATEARKILAGELAKKGGDPSLRITAVGHSHLDLAWLWPIRETIRKAARTFSTVLDLMERYPDYVFGASQAQLYEWVKKHYPVLYGDIKKRIAEGRWEVQGGMWVEADTNVSGGEALVRQFLYGKRFFAGEFGIEIDNLWLPDVFGYSGSLPQIMRGCGVKYFMTQKLSWNDINSFPHHTFWWEGIDGSKVLTHMLPENDYSSHATPGAILKAERNYKDKAVCDRCLMLFGIGDGGGGPGREHLERLGRVKNLSGLPQVVQEPAERLFRKIEKDAARFKTWKGELYLEKHRGTYTTQARNKMYNRKMELALRELEFFATTAGLLAGTDYPAEQIESVWKEVLLYQFHDILPGSSIKRVYDESVGRYEQMYRQVNELLGERLAAIAGGIDTSKKKRPVLMSNSLSWERNEWVKVDGRWLYVSVPASGFAVVDTADTDGAKGAAGAGGVVAADRDRIENELLCVRFGADGSIQSIYDKCNGREVVTDGRSANRFAVYVDRPGYWEAWDIAIDYADRRCEYFELSGSKAFVDGPRCVMRQEYRFDKSTISQEVILTAGSRKIDFVTTVDWNQDARMLRSSFGLGIDSEYATCEIQYGNIRRPTNPNTSWDMAKFEVCAQKWVDISSPDYGVALLNDCKYGYKVLGNVLDINLLRSPSWPDPQTDRTKHNFTYSLLPHAGDFIRGGVVRAAYELNVPIGVTNIKAGGGDGGLCGVFSLVNVDADNVVVEAVKKAEGGQEMIVRLYEATGARVKAKVGFGVPVVAVQLVNMLEEKPKKLRVKAGCVELEFRPFEIHTLKVSMGQKGQRR